MAKTANPLKLMATLNTQQWLFYMVALLAWIWDAFDFFTVSLTVSDMAADFGKSIADITWGITLVLMFRSFGSIAFGIAADRYGRKWYDPRRRETAIASTFADSASQAIRRQQHPLHHPRAWHRILPDI
jgi:MFS family permease